MATPLLDFAELTAPLEGEQPAGVRLPADVRKKMEDARKEFEPDPDNPSAPPVPKKPDWSAIVVLATNALAKNAKDLLAAVRLVEALTQRDHFAGLRDGLILLRMLLTDCWGRVHPLIEEPDDLEYRAGPIQWLCDTESGAWFPTTISKLPLLRIGGQDASLADCREGKLDGEPLSADAVRAAEPADAEAPADVAECLNELQTLDQALTEKMGDLAPALGSLRDVLNECARYLSNVRSEAASEENVEAGGSGSESAEPGQARAASGVLNRAETYRQLARLADHLAEMEPHSPIPDLLRWAVTLGAMPFRDLIQELVREPAVLSDIRRQLGIKEEAPPSE